MKIKMQYIIFSNSHPDFQLPLGLRELKNGKEEFGFETEHTYPIRTHAILRALSSFIPNL
jgi:hypothetical protein